MRNRTEIDDILQAFLQKMPNKRQSEAAKMLKIPKKRFHDYYNGKYNPTETLLVHMERFLQARGIDVGNPKWDPLTDCIAKLSYSERAKRVLGDEEWGKKPSGRPKKLALIKCHHDDTLWEKKEKKKKNRRDDKLAKKYQFPSRFTMRIAVLVLTEGCIELILALDQGAISFSCAKKLARLPKSLQRELLIQHTQDKQAILNYFKKSAPVETSDQADIAVALKLVKKHPKLTPLAPETRQLFQDIFEEVLYGARC